MDGDGLGSFVGSVDMPVAHCTYIPQTTHGKLNDDRTTRVSGEWLTNDKKVRKACIAPVSLSARAVWWPELIPTGTRKRLAFHILPFMYYPRCTGRKGRDRQHPRR